MPSANDMTDDMPEVARIAAFEIHHDRLMREIEQLKKDRDFWSSEASRLRDDVRRLQDTCENEWAARVAELMRERDKEHGRAEGMRDAMLAYGIRPIPMVLHCPKCRGQHIDREEWATYPHKTHRCEHCGELFRVAEIPTVGVEAL